jgi:hypothetical protein
MMVFRLISGCYSGRSDGAIVARRTSDPVLNIGGDGTLPRRVGIGNGGGTYPLHDASDLGVRMQPMPRGKQPCDRLAASKSAMYRREGGLIVGP